MDPLKFRNRTALLLHFIKHGPVLQAKSPKEYEALANEVVLRGIKTPAKRGAIRVFDPLTKEHVIIDPKNNKLLTYYVRKALLDA